MTSLGLICCFQLLLFKLRNASGSNDFSFSILTAFKKVVFVVVALNDIPQRTKIPNELSA
jgi:hypothetical protein